MWSQNFLQNNVFAFLYYKFLQLRDFITVERDIEIIKLFKTGTVKICVSETKLINLTSSAIL